MSYLIFIPDFIDLLDRLRHEGSNTRLYGLVPDAGQKWVVRIAEALLYQHHLKPEELFQYRRFATTCGSKYRSLQNDELAFALEGLVRSWHRESNLNMELIQTLACELYWQTSTIRRAA
jgi:hypothetical protein